MDTDHFALWWIPAGHTPSVEEAKQRLLYRQEHGNTALAFSFTHPSEMLPQPVIDLPDENHITLPLNYDGRIVALCSRSELGDCGRQTLFRCRQKGFRLWATYEGDGVRFGSLVAASDSGGHRATRSSLIGRGRPGRSSSCSPATPCSTNRRRHLPTVALVSSQLTGDLSVHLPGCDQQNDPHPSHQPRRKRAGTGHAFQLCPLLRTQYQHRFRSSHRHRHLHCASETPIFLAILTTFTYGTEH